MLAHSIPIDPTTPTTEIVEFCNEANTESVFTKCSLHSWKSPEYPSILVERAISFRVGAVSGNLVFATKRFYDDLRLIKKIAQSRFGEYFPPPSDDDDSTDMESTDAKPEHQIEDTENPI